MRGRPPGFSPVVCIRTVSRIDVAGSRRSYQTSAPRLYSARSIFPEYQCLSRPCFDIALGRPACHAARAFSNSRHFSQATAAVQEESDGLSATEPQLPDIPTSLEELTVKELRSLLASRSLKTTGLKKELIDRLQAATQNKASTTDVNADEDTSLLPSSATLSVGELSKLSVKELRELLAERGLSTQGLKAQLLERLESVDQPIPLVVELAESVVDASAPLDVVSDEIHKTSISPSALDSPVSENLTTSKSQSSELDVNARDQVHETLQQLEVSITQITELESQVAILEPQAPPTSPPTRTLPSPPNASPTDPISNRVTLRAKIYFTKVFSEGLTSDPSTTNNVILAELMFEDEAFLREAFLNQVSVMGQTGRRLEEKELHDAWMSALEKLVQRKNSLRYTAAPTKETEWSIEREREPKAAEEHPKMVEKDEAVTTVSEKPTAEPPKIKLLDAKVPSSREKREGLSANQWTHLIRVKLSENPITLRLQLNDELRRRYTHIFDDCQAIAGDILNPMWERLGLLEHILVTHNGPGDFEYLVTFKTFDAAAAFVNQVNGHWIDDEMTGQVYVTWDPIETIPDNVRANLTFPRATIEPWRFAAKQRKVEISKHGYPMVDWGQSLQGVFRRMNITAGRDGACRSWKVVGEYSHVVIMEIGFKDTESMKRFVARKDEHYLSNPWKDRFFVKQKDRYFSPLGGGDC